MPSAFEHGPTLTVVASPTANAGVIWSAANNLGQSTVLLGTGTLGISGDTDIITLTANTVTVAGTVAATTLTGNGAGVTALAAANITASGTLPALNGAALTALNGTQITSGTLPAARIADDSIVEAKLDVSNAPTNGHFLQAQSGEGGGLTWAAATTSFIGVRVENSSNQSVANNSVAKLTFDASVTKFDTDTMHSSSNADRITFTTAGYYWCGLSYMWEGHSTGRRNVWVSSTLAAGGGNTLVRQTISPSTADEQHNVLSFIYQFAAGDYIEWYAHQTSGTSLNIHADNESSAVAMAYKIG